MKNLDKLSIIRYGFMAASGILALVQMYLDDKEQEEILAKLVDEKVAERLKELGK